MTSDNWSVISTFSPPSTQLQLLKVSRVVCQGVFKGMTQEDASFLLFVSPRLISVIRNDLRTTALFIKALAHSSTPLQIYNLAINTVASHEEKKLLAQNLYVKLVANNHPVPFEMWSLLQQTPGDLLAPQNSSVNYTLAFHYMASAPYIHASDDFDPKSMFQSMPLEFRSDYAIASHAILAYPALIDHVGENLQKSEDFTKLCHINALK